MVRERTGEERRGWSVQTKEYEFIQTKEHESRKRIRNDGSDSEEPGRKRARNDGSNSEEPRRKLSCTIPERAPKAIAFTDATSHLWSQFSPAMRRQQKRLALLLSESVKLTQVRFDVKLKRKVDGRDVYDKHHISFPIDDALQDKEKIKKQLSAFISSKLSEQHYYLSIGSIFADGQCDYTEEIHSDNVHLNFNRDYLKELFKTVEEKCAQEKIKIYEHKLTEEKKEDIEGAEQLGLRDKYLYALRKGHGSHFNRAHHYCGKDNIDMFMRVIDLAPERKEDFLSACYRKQEKNFMYVLKNHPDRLDDFMGVIWNKDEVEELMQNLERELSAVQLQLGLPGQSAGHNVFMSLFD